MSPQQSPPIPGSPSHTHHPPSSTSSNPSDHQPTTTSTSPSDPLLHQNLQRLHLQQHQHQQQQQQQQAPGGLATFPPPTTRRSSPPSFNPLLQHSKAVGMGAGENSLLTAQHRSSPPPKCPLNLTMIKEDACDSMEADVAMREEEDLSDDNQDQTELVVSEAQVVKDEESLPGGSWTIPSASGEVRTNASVLSKAGNTTYGSSTDPADKKRHSFQTSAPQISITDTQGHVTEVTSGNNLVEDDIDDLGINKDEDSDTAMDNDSDPMSEFQVHLPEGNPYQNYGMPLFHNPFSAYTQLALNSQRQINNRIPSIYSEPYDTLQESDGGETVPEDERIVRLKRTLSDILRNIQIILDHKKSELVYQQLNNMFRLENSNVQMEMEVLCQLGNAENGLKFRKIAGDPSHYTQLCCEFISYMETCN